MRNVLIYALTCVVYALCVPNVVFIFTETVMIILNQWYNRLGDNYKWVNVITLYRSIKTLIVQHMEFSLRYTPKTWARLRPTRTVDWFSCRGRAEIRLFKSGHTTENALFLLVSHRLFNVLRTFGFIWSSWSPP